MKRILSLSLLFALAACARAVAAYPRTTDAGVTSTGTVYTVQVTTNVGILYSTGTNIIGEESDRVSFFSVSPSTSVTQGQFMQNRVNLEVKNDSNVDVYLGYDLGVSSIAGNPKRGRMVEANGGVFIRASSIKDIFAVAGSSTGFNVTVTQEQ